LTKKIIEKKLLEEEAAELAEVYKEQATASTANNLKRRQEIFKKNEEAPL
jgi:hypothetical protein